MKMKIKTKVISGFTVIFAMGLIMGIFALYSIRNIAAMSEKQASLQEANTDISSVLTAHYVWRQNLTLAVMNNTEFTGSYKPDSCALGVWRNSDKAMNTTDNEIMTLLNQLDEPHRIIHTEAETVMNMMKSGNTDEARLLFMNTILPNANTAISILDQMTEHYGNILSNHTSKLNSFVDFSLSVIITLLIISTFLSILIAVLLLNSIMKPLVSLAKTSDIVASGNFNVNIAYSVNDEIGMLTNSLATLVNTFKYILADINKMADMHTKGDIEYFIENSNYNGEFKSVVSSVNGMIKDYVDNTNTILNIAQKYAEGDFSAKLGQLPGKKVIANKIMDTVSNNLINVKESIMQMVASAMDGKLDENINESGFKGDWKNIVISMNKLLGVINAPLLEAQNVLSLVSEGKFDVKISGKYNGQFDKMASSINKTIETVSMYINDISVTLNEMASDNYNLEINKEYIGSFGSIKTSLIAIISRLNDVIAEIGSASEQVSAGADHISEMSITLSQSAAEQAGSVEELNATIDEISNMSNDNAKNSTEANNLSSAAKDNAELGNAMMSEMVRSMTEINAASQNISKIIKVIEDIAFQTNLLALNAAVEAARAGEHGKGFAVVAEEVRSLAGRSQSAAKETTGLIEHTIEKVSDGTKIANDTAAALTKIVGAVGNVSEIIDKIETASKEQAASITLVNEGIRSISQVTQGYTITAEKSASSSEELSGQSTTLNAMISRFKLKNRSKQNKW